MGKLGRFALVLAVTITLACAGLAGALARADRDGLPTHELLRVEPLPESPISPAEDHLRFMFELLGGTRTATVADGIDRFTPELREAITAADLNEIAAVVAADSGSVSLVRVGERGPRSISGLGVAEDGTTGQVQLVVTPGGLVEALVFLDYPGEPSTLPAWEATLVLAATWIFIGCALLARKYDATVSAWTLLAASIPTVATIAVLSDLPAVYTAGRVIPPFTAAFAVALLLAPHERLRRAVVGTALAAGVIGGLAPLARDSELIGHPMVFGRFIDSDGLHRALLGTSAALVGMAMGTVLVLTFRSIASTARSQRPARWMTAITAAAFVVAAFGTSVDSLLGEGTLASGPFRAIGLSALAAVPAATVLRLTVDRWARAEIAALVIDLESDGIDLAPAIAKALDDPSLRLLTSPDGQRLVGDADMDFGVENLPAGTTLTRIQSGDRLVGGLIHTSVLQRDPARLEAVAAAAGMALELRRLNSQVVSQLDEVNASRVRILQASDTARRRLERDLHDGAQQRLVALGLLLQRARRQAGSADEDSLANLLDVATREVRGTIDEIRAVSRGQQPALLVERGLATAVDALAERAPVPVRLDLGVDDLTPSAERTAYYVIAEGLTNVAKHAVATSAAVSIARHDGHALVTICDNGRGGAEVAAGSGLEGLNDRVAAAGGTFSISSGPTGTTLEASIPCE